MRSWISECPDWVIVLAAGLLLTGPANAVVRRVFLSIRLRDQEGTAGGLRARSLRWKTVLQGAYSGVADRRGAGRWIGSLERLIILMMVLAGQPAAASLVVAAKSILRFPEINADIKAAGSGRDAITAEYVLVGSLTSWLLGFGIAVLAKAAIDWN